MNDQQRYLAAAHAMQTGVKMQMELDPGPTTPKHLRAGVNSSLVNQGALVKLLVDKGIITDEEYLKAMADMMELEVKHYEVWLSELYGRTVTLG